MEFSQSQHLKSQKAHREKVLLGVNPNHVSSKFSLSVQEMWISVTSRNILTVAVSKSFFRGRFCILNSLLWHVISGHVFHIMSHVIQSLDLWLSSRSEPFLNEDKKDRQNLVQPPSLEEDEEDKDLFNYDAYYPTSLPLRRPGESAELAQTSNLDEELLHENVSSNRHISSSAYHLKDILVHGII